MKQHLIAAACASVALALAAPVFSQPLNTTVIQPNIRIATALWAKGAPEAEAWRIAEQQNTVAAYEAFMRDYPNSPHFNTARDRRRALLDRTTMGEGPDRGGPVIVLPPKVLPPVKSPPPAPPSPLPPPPPPPPPPVVMPPSEGELRTKTFEMKKAESKDSAPSEAKTMAPAPSPGPGGNTGSAGVRTQIEAVMTELLPSDQRRAQNGGAAMVLLTGAPNQAAQSMALCRALFTQLDTATTGEIDVGVRKVDGIVQILRPVYWFARANRQPKAAGPDACGVRIANYHYARARAIMTQVGLRGEGPFLAVVRTDDRAAGFIDLSGKSEAEIAVWVRYFRDSYSKRDRVWAPEVNTEQAARRDLVAVLGEQLARTLSTVPKAVFR